MRGGSKGLRYHSEGEAAKYGDGEGVAAKDGGGEREAAKDGGGEGRQ